MKAKSFVAYALTACTVPLGSALAAHPSGPQGTGWYGAPNAAVPVPQLVTPYYVEPMYPSAPTPQHPTDAGAFSDSVARPAGERWVYQGNSFDTNPPAPAP